MLIPAFAYDDHKLTADSVLTSTGPSLTSQTHNAFLANRYIIKHLGRPAAEHNLVKDQQNFFFCLPKKN